MIEVEKQFLLSSAQEKRLKNGAKLMGEKVFTDMYFDNKVYELTKNDIWLRTRDKRVELKIPVEQEKDDKQPHFERYEEFDQENEVRQMLNIPKGGEFLLDIKKVGFVPFATITTRREKYKKLQFNIDFDACDFGYIVVEIEQLVEQVEQVKEAELRITEFAMENSLEIRPVRDKVIEYLYRKSPEHYKILQEEGIIIK